MVHSLTRRPGSGRQRSTNARQEQRIVREVVALRTAPREEIRAPVVSPRTIGNGNRLLVVGLSASGQATTYTSLRHRQARLF